MKNFGFLLFLGIGFLTQAQTITSTIAEPSRWTFGGGAGVGISSGNGRTGTSINIIPRIGYRLTEDLEAGVAGSFTWANSKYFSTTMLGVGPFANYYFSRSFYISGNFQQYFVDQKDKIYNEKYNKDESALYLGAGYMQSSESNGALSYRREGCK